jgi:hypothetical protein
MENNMDENLSQDGTQENQSTEVQVSAVESQAMESGWVPKEQYHGEEHKWVDAGEFLRRGELFKKIEDQSKQLKDVRTALNEMKKLHSQVREVEYKRALDALRIQKKTALEEGDAEAVIAADERIDLVKEQVSQLKVQQTNEQIQESASEHPEFVQWTAQNSWYNTSTPMKAFADALGRELAQAGNSPSEVLKKVAIEVRKEFPHKFKNPNQEKPGAVESGTQRNTSKSNFVLTDEQRKIMHTFVKTGALTEKEYIESLKKIGA